MHNILKKFKERKKTETLIKKVSIKTYDGSNEKNYKVSWKVENITV